VLHSGWYAVVVSSIATTKINIPYMSRLLSLYSVFKGQFFFPYYLYFFIAI
jgi:hypothetical protein